ncbi:hypothetical protein JZ751_017500 [Albula glossodonta]|uniref:EGF-like domain-containing protein n=1 Tax=Albula glossodonta TaxID=121402 RepID=A0A8T2PK20_9TELE|nr:hypothetical protein JZ751_017500 [Albula glossodonta]
MGYEPYVVIGQKQQIWTGIQLDVTEKTNRNTADLRPKSLIWPEWAFTAEKNLDHWTSHLLALSPLSLAPWCCLALHRLEVCSDLHRPSAPAPSWLPPCRADFSISVCVITPLSLTQPNVCAEREVRLVTQKQPCVQAFTRMVKVWKQGCVSQNRCLGYERSWCWPMGGPLIMGVACRNEMTMPVVMVTMQPMAVKAFTSLTDTSVCSVVLELPLPRQTPSYCSVKDHIGISVCSYGVCFNGGQCGHSSSQLCDCPPGFNGPSCQYGELCTVASTFPTPSPSSYPLVIP